MRKNWFIFISLLTALAGLGFVACEEEEEVGNSNILNPKDPTQKKDYIDYIDLKRDAGIAKWEFGTSAATSLLYHMETTNGEHFVVDARKDANGIPTSLLSLVIQSKGQNPEVSQFLFDEQNRPVDVTAPNGIRILYEWIGDTQAAITFIDPETDEQLNTVYDFAEGEAQKVAPSPSTTSHPMRDGEATLSVKPLTGSETSRPAKVQTAPGDRQGTIILKTCGVDVKGQECWVKVYDKGSYGSWSTELTGYRGRYDAKYQSEGKYVYTLPAIDNAPAIAEFLNIAGPKIKWLVDKMCLPNMNGSTYTDPMTLEMITGVCLTVMAKVSITGPLAVKIGAACTALGTALLLYCNTLNKAIVSNDPNSPSVQDLPVVKDLIDATFGKLWNNFVVKPATEGVPLDVYVCVRALPKSTMDYAYTTGSSSSDPLPVYELNTNTEPKIQSFKLNPPAPIARQGYEAIATLSCMPEGTVAVMTVVGTDGYDKTESVTLNNVISYELRLYVPGGAGGVKDLCTIGVQLPDGTLLKKQASLVFQSTD